MSWLSRRASEIAGRLVRNRDRLPRFLDRLITSASKNPDGVVGRMASLLLAGSSQDLPAATTAPPTPTRAALRWTKLFENPDNAVIVDQIASPMLSSRVRTQLSASRPSGMPNSA